MHQQTNDVNSCMPADIDQLETSRSLIDLQAHSQGDFGNELQDYSLRFIIDDVMLVEYVDVSADGKEILRNGIFVPVNAVTKAWRKAKVVLAGPNVKYAKVGDVVVFPNDKGIPVSNIAVHGYGKVKNGIFLNEQRIFGICEPLTNEQ